MALYIPHSIFHLARLLYVRPETFGPYYVRGNLIYHDIFRFKFNFPSPPLILDLSGIPLRFIDYPDVCTNAKLFLYLIKQHDTKI